MKRQNQPRRFMGIVDKCALAANTQETEPTQLEDRSVVKARALVAFCHIRSILRSVDPLRLLARICIQCNTCEASETGALNVYFSPWAAWSDVIAYLVLLGDCTPSCTTNPTRKTIEALGSQFSDYWQGVVPLESPTDHESCDNIINVLAENCRKHAAQVKHDACSYQYEEAARRLYSPKNVWLKENRGFTVQEAIATMHGISSVAIARVDCEIAAATAWFTSVQREETAYADVMLPALDREPDLAVLTQDDIVSASNIRRESCLAVLERFSQHIEGHSWNDVSEQISDLLDLPYRYNRISARPIFEINGKYVCPQLMRLDEAIFLSLNYDLLDNGPSCNPYSTDRCNWLEQATADYLTNVFGRGPVCKNPFRDNGEELCDTLVYYDNVIIVVSCKAKMLTLSAEYGNDAAKLRDDLEKSIGNSYRQIEGTLAYLKRSDTANIFRQDGELWQEIDVQELDAVIPIYVLPSGYQDLTINTRDIFSGLGIQVSASTVPWVVGVFDLESITEILRDSPALFLHYVMRRRQMILGKTHVLADERNLIGSYLNTGLYFGSGFDYSQEIDMMISNASAKIDTYLMSLHNREPRGWRPRAQFPFVRSGLVDDIALTGAAHRTIALLRLLDLPEESQDYFLQQIDSCRETATVLFKDDFFGVRMRFNKRIVVSYFAGRGTSSELLERAMKYAKGELMLYHYDASELVCLVGDVTVKTRVQSFACIRFI